MRSMSRGSAGFGGVFSDVEVGQSESRKLGRDQRAAADGRAGFSTQPTVSFGQQSRAKLPSWGHPTRATKYTTGEREYCVSSKDRGRSIKEGKKRDSPRHNNQWHVPEVRAVANGW